MSGAHGDISIFSLTAGGALLALRLRDRFGGTVHLPRCHSLGCGRCDPFDSIADALPERFQAGDTLVCIMAAGIVFRLLAPHLRAKQSDPAVIVVDEEGRFAVPLLGGHAAGANRLAEEIAASLGGSAVITTSSDVQGLTAPDEAARLLGARVADGDALRRLTGMLVNGERVCIEAESDPGFEGYEYKAPGESSDGCAGRLLVTHEVTGPDTGIPTVKLVPQRLAAGVGCKRGTAAEEIVAALEEACRELEIDPLALGKLASVDIKSGEEGMLEAAERLGIEPVFYSAGDLEALGRSGNEFVKEHAGTPAVSEPAALLAGGWDAVLLQGKTARGNVTTALALSDDSLTVPGSGSGRVSVVGIGAGTRELLTGEAARAIEEAETVIGYRTYIEQLKDIYPDKEYVSGSMGAEIERCHQALEQAAAGGRVALVSSGDPGVYGMAGPLLELADGITVDIIPGVTAAQTAAARLGAPLMNDYVSLSLSDLLTPRAEVLRRTEEAARSGLVIAIYNPTSRKRQPLFESCCDIILEHRRPDTPVGMVRKAGSTDEEVSVFTLAELKGSDVDMRCTIIIGSERTHLVEGRLVTRRGYEDKKSDTREGEGKA